MAKAFYAGAHGIVGYLESAERQLLRRLCDDLLELLSSHAIPSGAQGKPGSASDSASMNSEGADPLAALAGINLDASKPTDPALLKLFPDAHASDEEVALEFRRFAEPDIKHVKEMNIKATILLLEGKGTLSMSAEQAQIFAKTLNDLRLVLATRLDITSDEDAEKVHQLDHWDKADDADSYLAVVYNFITWLQDSLMSALIDDLENPNSSTTPDSQGGLPLV